MDINGAITFLAMITLFLIIVGIGAFLNKIVGLAIREIIEEVKGNKKE